MRLYQDFGVSVSDDTVYRALNAAKLIETRSQNHFQIRASRQHAGA